MSDKNLPSNESNTISIEGMYKDYFLDYASYVILERAIPYIQDGLKPVQRRILHSMKEMDDGRYNKVANIIGQTMQYHPHGDAAIGGALVKLGQKNLLIDTQGNWGDFRTGDSSAAPRYIEARLSKFALEVAFNKQTTNWKISYDGRKNEPIQLPMKFPLLLAQGTEGIAVGLSTKVLPHNFLELCKAAIKYLEDKPFQLFPDFETGGMIDVTDYNKGKRGGKVMVRAKIEKKDKSTLLIKELPFGVTTTALIDSVLKAVEKGKIKIKKIADNTAKDVEIEIELYAGVSPDVTIDALYAFSSCQVSISPNACVIVDNKPHFLTIYDLLRISVDHTKGLLKRELEIRKGELEEKLLFASLEKIFIQNRIYHHIEECETWDSVMETIDLQLKNYVVGPDEQLEKGDTRIRLVRNVEKDDIIRLTEIKIKRISKYNSFKADDLMQKLTEELKEILHHLANLTQYAIDYFQMLIEKFGEGKERKTVITNFETIKIASVAANNAKLYVNRKEGFIGSGLKNAEFVSDCSDIDDIIVFTASGICTVVKIDTKVFTEKDIIHCAVWRKNDERTTYNMVYKNGKTGVSYVKRFNITSITRNKIYPLASKEKNSKVLHFTVNPNGEAEVIGVKLSSGSRARKKQFEFDFSDLDIKGRGAKGNILSKYAVRKVELLEEGKSTIGALQVYFDKTTGKLNTEERGVSIGGFDTGSQILVIYKDGNYEIVDFTLTRYFDYNKVFLIEKFDPQKVVSVLYYDGEKEWSMFKRFLIETKSTDTLYPMITEHKKSKFLLATTQLNPKFKFVYKKDKEKVVEELVGDTFIDVKGWKAKGNRISESRISGVELISFDEPKLNEETEKGKLEMKDDRDSFKPGDTIEFDFPD